MWDEITYPFPNFNGCTVEAWEWISNFIPHFIVDVITYPCWDESWSMLVYIKELQAFAAGHWFKTIRPVQYNTIQYYTIRYNKLYFQSVSINNPSRFQSIPRGLRLKQWSPWSGEGILECARMGTMKQSGPWGDDKIEIRRQLGIPWGKIPPSTGVLDWRTAGVLGPVYIQTRK